jgi:hypothetical protein
MDRAVSQERRGTIVSEGTVAGWAGREWNKKFILVD